MRLEWDPNKDAANQNKHGVAFSEAQELFESDSDCLEIVDENHLEEEERFIAIGPVKRGIIVVVWTEPFEDAIRIVSARWATRRECALFRKHMEAK